MVVVVVCVCVVLLLVVVVVCVCVCMRAARGGAGGRRASPQRVRSKAGHGTGLTIRRAHHGAACH